MYIYIVRRSKLWLAPPYKKCRDPLSRAIRAGETKRIRPYENLVALCTHWTVARSPYYDLSVLAYTESTGQGF